MERVERSSLRFKGVRVTYYTTPEQQLVAPAGIEPSTLRLKGGFPEPLEYGAVATIRGFEPRFPG